MMVKQVGWMCTIHGKPCYVDGLLDPREVHNNGKPVYPVYREIKPGMKVRLPDEIGVPGMVGFIKTINEKEGWILTGYMGKAIQLRVDELELV